MVNKLLRCLKRENLLNFGRNIKSPFMTYADVESILVSEDNEKQNPNESYTNKYEKHVTSSFAYNRACVDDKFRKSFKSYLGKYAVYNFISSMIDESKYVMKE